jgi:hypothetical protein
MNALTTRHESKDLQPASEEEMRSSLKALFDQFPSQDGGAEGKFLGYLLALEGEPASAIRSAVRKFLRGDIPEHNARFLPTSAELARVVRDEKAEIYRVRMRESQREMARQEQRVKLTVVRPADPEEEARIAAKVARVKAEFDAAVGNVKVDLKDADRQMFQTVLPKGLR